MHMPIRNAPIEPTAKVAGGGGEGPAKKMMALESMGGQKSCIGRMMPHSSTLCMAHTAVASEAAARLASATLTWERPSRDALTSRPASSTGEGMSPPTHCSSAAHVEPRRDERAPSRR